MWRSTSTAHTPCRLLTSQPTRRSTGAFPTVPLWPQRKCTSACAFCSHPFVDSTGWGEQRYLREKTDGSYFNKGVFPGFSFELARFLVDERNIAGIAIDTLSGDVGGMPGVAFPVHDYLLVKHSKFMCVPNDAVGCFLLTHRQH